VEQREVRALGRRGKASAFWYLPTQSSAGTSFSISTLEGMGWRRPDTSSKAAREVRTAAVLLYSAFFEESMLSGAEPHCRDGAVAYHHIVQCRPSCT